jgi:hypothetical protein
MGTWLDKFLLIGIATVQSAGVALPQETTINFVSGATVVDNPSQNRTDITITALTTPTGTGFVHITSGVADAAARAVNLATADITGVLPAGNQAAQTMGGDVTGTTAASTVVGLTGTGAAPNATVAMHANAILFDTGVTQAAVSIAAASGAGTGAALTLGAQDRTSGTGGALVLHAGQGSDTTHAGSIQLQLNGLVARFTFGSDGLGYFLSTGAAPAQSGAFRLPNNAMMMAARNAAGAADIAILATDAANNLTLGDATNAASLLLKTAGIIDLTNCTFVRLGPALIASGGGVLLPTFTVGIGQANQPTTAAQNGWKKLQDTDGSTIWVPVWK